MFVCKWYQYSFLKIEKDEILPRNFFIDPVSITTRPLLTPFPDRSRWGRHQLPVYWPTGKLLNQNAHSNNSYSNINKKQWLPWFLITNQISNNLQELSTLGRNNCSFHLHFQLFPLIKLNKDFLPSLFAGDLEKIFRCSAGWHWDFESEVVGDGWGRLLIQPTWSWTWLSPKKKILGWDYWWLSLVCFVWRMHF